MQTNTRQTDLIEELVDELVLELDPAVAGRVLLLQPHELRIRLETESGDRKVESNHSISSVRVISHNNGGAASRGKM